jgi:hypothetical protein
MSETDSNDNFERRFAESLTSAEQNLWRAQGVVDHWVLQSAGPHSMPQIAIWRLHLSATATFLAILQCLKTRYSSLGAFSLIRGLVESWSHLYFIDDSSNELDAKSRAISIESGILHESIDLDSKLQPDLDRAERLRTIDEQVRRLANANDLDEVPKKRTYAHVSQTLKKMAEGGELRQPGLLYAASSSAVHMLASDFLIQVAPTEVSVTWVSDGRRCAWLQLAIMCFDHLTMTSLRATPAVVDDADILDLHSRWMALYNDKFLVDIVAGTGGSAS